MPTPSKGGARLEPKSLVVRMDSGMWGEFEIKHPKSEHIVSTAWTFEDADKKAITPVRQTGIEVPKNTRINTTDYGVSILGGENATYSKVKITGQVTLEDDKKNVRTVPVEGHATFSFAWGGMAKAWYPHPANYEMAWDADPEGRRALVLLWDMVCNLPEHMLVHPGGIPIVRTQNNQGVGKQYDAAHVPFWHDVIEINDSLVSALNPYAAGATPEDIRFISTVVHEIAHAITYKKATWGLHQDFAAIRKDMRTSPLGPVGWLPAGAAATAVLTVAVAQRLINGTDFVSGFAEEAGWELTSPLAWAAHALRPDRQQVDFLSWLARVPRKGLIPDFKLRPNLATGLGEIGRPLGLELPAKTTSDQLKALVASARDAEDKAAAAERARDKIKNATPVDAKKLAAAEKKLTDAKKAATTASKARFKAHSDAGVVSEYAAVDTLEDIAETFRFLVYGAAQLNKAGRLGRWYANLPASHPTLKGRRAFLVHEEVFPKTWKPIEVGALYKGNETNLHLENWTVEL